MHFRLAIIIVAGLVVLAGGILWYQSATKPELVADVPDLFAEDSQSLDSFERSVAAFDSEAALVGELEQTIDVILNDEPAEAITGELLDGDLRELDALGSAADGQATDDSEIDSSFSDLLELSN